MTKRSTRSFSSRLLLALDEGCKREVRISLPSATSATRFRYEVNALRATMRKEDHIDWRRYYEVGLYIDPGDPQTVIIRPKLADYKEALDAAGVPDLLAPDPDVPLGGMDTNTSTLDEAQISEAEESFLESIRKMK